MATKIKRNDKVIIIAGKDKGKEGKVLLVNRKKNRVIVEGVGMISKHQKPSAGNAQGGIVKKEASIHLSNVMFSHKGKATRLGYKIETSEKDGKTIKVKKRFAKTTGELVD